MTSLGGGAFAYCKTLTSVTLGNNVTSIGSGAFRCTALTSIAIPNSVTSIGDDAFYQCAGLTSVTIPNRVTSIGHFAFYQCSALTSITIPNSVTNIGDYAFYECSGLTSVTIPNSVTSIGGSAFYGCSGLESFIIGSGVQTIGENIFADHKPTKVIWLTNTPPSGYGYAKGIINYVANDQYTFIENKTVYPFLSSIFEVCGIKYVPVSPSERTCDAIDCNYSQEAENINIGETVSYNGIQMEVKRILQYACYGNAFIKNLLINFKGGVEDYVFYGCTGLKTVELGENIISIGKETFRGCSQLGSIVIPNSVTSIGASAFMGCSSIESIKIGVGVSEIPSYAFADCKALLQIKIPWSVTCISDNVFSGCSALKKVIMDEQPTELTLGSNGSDPLFKDCPLESVYIGRNIAYSTSSSKVYSPFYRNATLQSVEITDKETEVSDNEFYGCTSLKNVKIGNGVTKIGDWAFSGCSSIDYFSFGSSVTNIGKEAFSDCTAITKLISHADTPPTCGSHALDDINKWNCTLSVPQGLTQTYQQAEQWKDFFFINDDATGINPVFIKNAMVKSHYTLDGKRVSEPQKGVNIVRMNNGRTRKVVVK